MHLEGSDSSTERIFETFRRVDPDFFATCTALLRAREIHLQNLFDHYPNPNIVRAPIEIGKENWPPENLYDATLTRDYLLPMGFRASDNGIPYIDTSDVASIRRKLSALERQRVSGGVIPGGTERHNIILTPESGAKELSRLQAFALHALAKAREREEDLIRRVGTDSLEHQRQVEELRNRVDELLRAQEDYNTMENTARKELEKLKEELQIAEKNLEKTLFLLRDEKSRLADYVELYGLREKKIFELEEKLLYFRKFSNALAELEPTTFGRGTLALVIELANKYLGSQAPVSDGDIAKKP